MSSNYSIHDIGVFLSLNIIYTSGGRNTCHGALAGPDGLPGGGRHHVRPVHHDPRHHRHSRSLELRQPGDVPLQVRQELCHLHHRDDRRSAGHLQQFSADLQKL